MSLKKKNILFLIPFVFFLNKWVLSFIIYPSDFLITKVLFDTPDIQYYPIIISLANFDFYPSHNDIIQAENIFTFPYGSIILHSFLYKIFGYISILLSEFIFILLFFIVTFKIFKHIGFSFSSSILSTLFVLFIPIFLNLLSSFSIPYIEELRTTINYFFSVRFPRPQVSGFYYLAFIYLSLKFSKNIERNLNNKYAIYFAVILGLIVNSFFYFFIYCSLALLFLLIVNYKKNFFLFIKLNINFLLIFSFIFFIFLVPFFLQLYLGEPDHSARIGMVEIDFKDKIYLNKFFFNSILRPEPLLIFFTSILLTFFILKKFDKEKLFNRINIFFYLYIASIVTPFLFITFSPKVIAMYHFADYILMNGLLYIIIGFISISNFYLKRLKENYLMKFFVILIIFALISLQNYNILLASGDRDHVNKFNQIISDNNIVNSKTNLFTNDIFFSQTWLLNNNPNLIISDGFTNAIKDEQIVNNLIKGLKLIGINSNEFRKIINFEGKTHYGRNPLTTLLFNYKYQANKFRKFSKDDQYTSPQNALIKKISPLRVMINILPIDQKKLLIRKFDQEKNVKNDYGRFFVVINTDIIPNFFMNKNYDDFDILYKKGNILILRKN
jgi:hypothetical protein